ncbi:MAG: carboxypeptidase-like regulatory domain-containing protein [Fusobacteriaceae bacterium]|nr:carboxypeptidase-like regulatory domain-containing protein [Fusobacteriaceae bacterium]MBN2838181.1 carboxypeptidase-like regulatory domain-containing protein [Fusobacteriaceae bacterium]
MKKFINKMLLVAMFFSITLVSFGGPIEDKINKIVYSKELDFKNVPLADVLSIITKTSGVTIVPDATVGNINVDIYFGKGQSLGEIIRTIKLTHNLTSRELNNVLILGKDLNGAAGLPGTISGRVISKKTGEGVDGIKVYIAGEKERFSITSIGGYYLIKNIEPGTYILKTEGKDFKASGAIIEVKGNDGIKSDITLSYTDAALEKMDDKDSSKVSGNTIGKVRTEQGADKFTEKVQLKHAIANEVKQVIDSVVGKGIEVTSVEKQNMLVLKGDEGNIQTAKNLIAELDKPIKQVRITAQILDIANNLADELGINWGAANSAANLSTASNTDNTLLTASGGVFGSLNGILKLATNIGSAGDVISASVNLLQTTSDIEISARPAVVTINGETAELNITNEVKIGDTTTTDDDGNKTTEPTFKEAGTKLKVKATVRDGGNEKDTIMLEITSELSDFISSGEGAAQKSVVTNKVSVKDGGTIFIGGLKRIKMDKSENKIPFLGDIPVFGRLFKSEGLSNEKRDVIIQIKAEVVTEENANNEINSEGFMRSKTNLPETLFK